MLARNEREGNEGDKEHTKILDILVGEEPDETTGIFGANLLSSSPCLVDDNSVRQSGRDEGGAICELTPAAVPVEGNPRE